MKSNFETDRLTLSPLSLNNAAFIYALLNTKGWIEFIGDRNIKSIDDANNYINKILCSDGITYWVVSLKESDTAIGLVTLIKRDYLEHNDIGFAFLPQYAKQGYAFEAAYTILEELRKYPSYSIMLATTIPGNKSSIQLLEKLGLKYNREIIANEEKLLVYST